MKIHDFFISFEIILNHYQILYYLLFVYWCIVFVHVFYNKVEYKISFLCSLVHCMVVQKIVYLQLVCVLI